MAKNFSEMTWKEFGLAFMVTNPGCSAEYRTGDWRSQKPVTDKSKCMKCGVCYLSCPDDAIKVAADGTYDFDYDHCKGCGICATECWTGCISMVEEEK
jgi:pyruvate ferredoxin oxidoreductase delta subunit